MWEVDTTTRYMVQYEKWHFANGFVLCAGSPEVIAEQSSLVLCKGDIYRFTVGDSSLLSVHVLQRAN